MDKALEKHEAEETAERFRGRPSLGAPEVLVLAVGALVRFWNLGRESLWLDEGYTLWLSSQPPGEIPRILRGDNGPPLYYWIIHAVLWLLGDSEAALRSFSALCGVGVIGLCGLIAHRLYQNRPATLAAMTLACASPLLQIYSQEARSYEAMTLCLLLAWYGLLNLGRRRIWPLAGYVIAAGAMVYLHNLSWFYLLGLNIGYLLLPSSTQLRRRVGAVAVANALVVGAFVPWIPVLIEQLRYTEHVFAEATVGWEALVGMLVQSAGSVRMDVISGGVLLVIVVLGTLALSSPGRRRTSLAVLLVAIVPLVCMWAYSQFRPSIFLVRRVGVPAAAVFPVFFALLVVGFSQGSRWRALLAGSVCVVVLMGCVESTWRLMSKQRKEDWRSLTAHVNAQLPDGRTALAMVPNEGEILYRYYSRQQGAATSSIAGLPRGFFETEPPRCAQKIRSIADLRPLIGLTERSEVNRVLLIQSHLYARDPRDLTGQWMGECWIEGKPVRFQHILLREFCRPKNP